jgi:hypothetical protein
MSWTFNPFTGELDYYEAGVAGGTGDIATPDDGELHLTPKAASTGAEGTIFYCSDDDCVYVGTEA